MPATSEHAVTDLAIVAVPLPRPPPHTFRATVPRAASSFAPRGSFAIRVLIAGRLRFDGASCAEIIRGGADHILASRREPGCIAYDWSVDSIDPAAICVFEEWSSEAALGDHFRDPSYLAMRSHLESFTIIGFDVKLYGVAGIEPVYTAEGRPRDEIFGVRIAAT